MRAILFGAAGEPGSSASCPIPSPSARRADTPSAATPSAARKLRRFSMSSSGQSRDDAKHGRTLRARQWCHPLRAHPRRAILTRMRTARMPLALLLAGAAPLAAQTATDVAIIPRPASVSVGRGTFQMTGRTALWADREDSAVARRFAQDIAPATGFDLRVRVGAPTSGKRIVFVRAPRDTSLGPEGYRLSVTPGVITITSSAPAGAFYATQSLRQLLPAEIFRDAPLAGMKWTIPAVTIVDRPRFAWRGMHLDVSRHFMPKEFVKKYIDLLALHKMNSFHWHLTDDQGWRIEIKKYPRLTSVGAWRSADARRQGSARFDARRLRQQAARRFLHAGRRARDRRVRARAVRAHRPGDRDAGPLAGRDRRLPRPRQLRRHRSACGRAGASRRTS